MARLPIREVRLAVLRSLYTFYEEHGLEPGTDVHSVEEDIPEAGRGVVRSVVLALAEEGYVSHLGTEGLDNLKLTPDGVQMLEDPDDDYHAATIAQTQNFNFQGATFAGPAQVGNANVQKLEYSLVFEQLAEAIQSSTDIAEHEKPGLMESAKKLATNPAVVIELIKVLARLSGNPTE